jgi:hypothetical protein
LAILVLACAAVFFLFFCSGLHLPIWNAQGRLEQRLTQDLGLSLPPGSRVIHANSVALRDPGEYYAVEMPHAAVVPFIDAVRAAGTDPEDLDPQMPWISMTRTPSWWKPKTLPQVKRLTVNHRDRFGGYSWYYSPISSTVYVFWFRT